LIHFMQSCEAVAGSCGHNHPLLSAHPERAESGSQHAGC
jgi:hypothetical protein